MNGRKIAIMLFLMFFFAGVAYANSCVEVTHCQCVDYCKDNGYSDMSGNANQWWDNSIGKYTRGHVPMVGAVIVFDSWVGSKPNPYGHVAIVASIVNDREITVNHANWSPSGATDQKIYPGVVVKDLSNGNWTSVSVYGSGSYPILGFIYPKNPPVTSGSVCLGTVCGDAALYRAKLQTAQTVRFGTNMIPVTEVGWRPLVDQCEKAQQYFYLTKSSPTSQKYTAVPAPSSICASVIPACFAQ